MNPGRILALDLGRRRIGLAVSDALGITAQGLETIERTRLREDLDRIAQIAAGRQVVRFVLGDPRHMSGRTSAQSAWVREFGEKLAARSGLPVEYFDERLTSVEAGRVLRASGISIEKRARAVDRMAAVLLLSSYLERSGAEGGAEAS